MVTVLALVLHTAQCTVMVRRTKGNVLSQPCLLYTSIQEQIVIECRTEWNFRPKSKFREGAIAEI